MSLFKRPPPESGPVIYRPSDAASDPPARQYRTLAVDPAPPSAVASELSVLTRVNRRRGAILTFLVSVASIGSFGGVVYWAHIQDIVAGKPGLTPIIKADERPTRERPANTGGLQVPNQDNEAYQRINPQRAPNPPERLLPPPQQPTPPTPRQLTAASETPAATPAVAAATPAPAAAKPDLAGAPAAAKPGEEAPAGPSISSILEQVSGPVGGWRIQLASVQTEEIARATWAKLQGTNGDVLGSLRMQAARADLGAKGTWYRVQAGPLDEKQAQAACSRLKQRNVECLPVPPVKAGG